MNRKGKNGYLNGYLISWKSRGEKHITLSSTETECVAVSEVCTDILFVKIVMGFLGLRLEILITIHCDNVGVIFMGTNVKASLRTKNINTRYHFIIEYIVNGTVEIIFVP